MKVKPRRKYGVGTYLESDKDFVANNFQACVQFLERESSRLRHPKNPKRGKRTIVFEGNIDTDKPITCIRELEKVLKTYRGIAWNFNWRLLS